MNPSFLQHIEEKNLELDPVSSTKIDDMRKRGKYVQRKTKGETRRRGHRVFLQESESLSLPLKKNPSILGERGD